MKCSVFVLVVLGLLPNTLGGQSTRANQPALSVTISTPKLVIKKGLPVQVDYTISNLSSTDIHFAARNIVAINGGLEIHDDKGERPLTSWGRKLLTGKNLEWKDIPVTDGRLFTISAGGSLKGKILIGKTPGVGMLYDLNRPGKYTIQVIQLDPSSQTKVRSNVVVVSVTE